ncbi:hypothetical protein DI005_15810 [Prauserella sp. PE36]|uniref:SH3 domain-containing protein n=1 Tax=Prauserella endophytica TaxID=1592324 RepID=A0ABY2SCC8_9PSEU|nr:MULTISPECIES: SH3 domain-containing protein [Prauserella]PXY35038.1 hypothetical protein BAY59_06105 [Prauserella coralliicola]RBM19168.1 hypothetical protein DI005_15810 [Prauserella sp. PE36]TKG73568.1 SH3 domain-containing protein [Prauserella endophytica]
MFVSLRVGLFVRVLVVAAMVAAGLMLVLSSRAEQGAPQGGDRRAGTEQIQASEAAETRYRVSGTDGAGLNVRACPDADCVKVGWLDEGAPFVGTCWEPGTAVASNTMWVSGTVDGRTGFVSAHYLRPESGVGAPACEDPVDLAR